MSPILLERLKLVGSLESQLKGSDKQHSMQAAYYLTGLGRCSTPLQKEQMIDILIEYLEDKPTDYWHEKALTTLVGLSTTVTLSLTQANSFNSLLWGTFRTPDSTPMIRQISLNALLKHSTVSELSEFLRIGYLNSKLLTSLLKKSIQ